MIVVADTSPLNYLIQIELVDLLQKHYQRVLVPPVVIQELTHPSAPPAVKTWLLRLPPWIDIVPAKMLPDSTLAALDPGEREAIQLAQERQANRILMDERKGRLEAQRRGFLTTGTLGVLIAAGDLGLIEPETAFDKLVTLTTFRTTSSLRVSFLEIIRTRKPR